MANQEVAYDVTKESDEPSDGAAGTKPLQSAIEQLLAMFTQERVPTKMGQTFALLCQTIVNDIRSAWLAAKPKSPRDGTCR